MSQTINPDQIRPYGTDGQLVGTLGGATVPLKVIAGVGISVTMSGNNIVISASAPPVPLVITGFSGGQSLELGFSLVNPAFSISYTGTPTSANITNTDGSDSPHVLSSPFTSATLAATFVKTTVADVTFTAHASNGTDNPTATQDVSWQPRIFGGVGSSGATSTVTASGTNAILSTSDSIPTIQLGAESVGQSLGAFSPSGQNIYLLLIGGSHTFIDIGTGFPMAFDTSIAVSFVNANGVAVSMHLYPSTNSLTGIFTPRIAS